MFVFVARDTPFRRELEFNMRFMFTVFALLFIYEIMEITIPLKRLSKNYANIIKR